MKKKEKKQLIEMFKDMINQERIIDIEMGLQPFVNVGEPIINQMVITYKMKSKE